MSLQLIGTICWIWISLAAVVFVCLLAGVKAPYGKLNTANASASISNRWGWFWMELPSFAIMLVILLQAHGDIGTVEQLLFALWLFHYFNRTFVFPFRTRTQGKVVPLSIVVSGMFFNAVNATINGYFLMAYSQLEYATAGEQLRVAGGLLLFFVGLVINWYSDHLLINLRKPGETSYRIPRGGLFRWVSCPNLLGEIIEWTGFFIIAWNLPAATFLIWTMANLIPRAINSHRWYQATFADYPTQRRALLPFLL
jgi:3-oxo-5-alpha-steroid 4-dehydrogenase 1